LLSFTYCDAPALARVRAQDDETRKRRQRRRDVEHRNNPDGLGEQASGRGAGEAQQAERGVQRAEHAAAELVSHALDMFSAGLP
jgi:hypothetical protein